MKHIINCLVENQPGVLARIVGLISGRGYNIETLNVGPTADPTVSKMTIVVPGDSHIIDQVTQQLAKQVDVIEVVNMTNRRHLDRELILVRVATANHHARAEIVDLAALFMARVVAVQEESVTIQMVGNQETVADFLRLLRPYSIVDISRTGVIAVGREVPELAAQKG
ncbi:MAG TPA: acetolactate synthase small subunit [Kiritimatiellia bacterium]|mgnify:FL=1|nr:acetolactate synthase small subunit [Kiritimatiellia bacterium]HRU71563.1 acetolactate synthase small subunit [Kiritimatiellia bacterium]